MKKTINDRLILLATAQECMADVADKMVQWDKSQLIMEKSAFDSMNVSDEVLRLSKEGSVLVDRLIESCQAMLENPNAVEHQKMSVVLEEIYKVFYNISVASTNVSMISHKIEKEAAAQKDIEEELKEVLVGVSESIDSAVACAELILAEI
ncbi:MAG: hypothetical protein PHF63_01200 [Herbinix sp.]|nr:hypothetical protein [Herbinix sp.]